MLSMKTCPFAVPAAVLSQLALELRTLTVPHQLRVGGGREPAPVVPVPPVAPRCVVHRLAGGRGAGGLMVSHLVCRAVMC